MTTKKYLFNDQREIVLVKTGKKWMFKCDYHLMGITRNMTKKAIIKEHGFLKESINFLRSKSGLIF